MKIGFKIQLWAVLALLIDLGLQQTNKSEGKP